MTSTFLKFVAVFVLLASVGQLRAEDQSPPETIDNTKAIYLNQGWTDEDRDWFYYTTQGSRLFPYRWFLALEQAESSTLFRDDAHIRKLGYLPGKVSPRNLDRLPIGFAQDRVTPERPLLAFDLKQSQLKLGSSPNDVISNKFLRSMTWSSDLPYSMNLQKLPGTNKLYKPKRTQFPDKENWVGLTCAACHTGVIAVGHAPNRKYLYIDGAPTMSDFSGLLEGLTTSLLATTKQPSKFDRFAEGVLGPNASKSSRLGLMATMEQFNYGLAGLAERSHPINPFGYGRLDAFGILLNEVAGTAVEEQGNWERPSAPVSYPFLWDTPDLDWVQWNGFSHSTLGRNMGEVLGVFGDLDMSDLTQIRTSANIDNLYLLEERVKKLKRPKWPKQHFGNIDPQLKKRGEEVYKTYKCDVCHALQPYPMTIPPTTTPPTRSTIRIVMTPIQELGTDSSMALNITSRVGKTGLLKEKLKCADVAPLARIFGKAVELVVKSEFKRLEIPPERKYLMIDRRGSKTPTPQHLNSYKARPLAGIWATAPYLHNGSVASLYELLLPPGKRKTKFKVGSLQFDTKEVGFRTDKGGFELDTSLRGNRNTGHYYGTNMSDKDRWALIEYLKSL